MFRYAIKNQRLLAILLLGFSSGLPLALTGSTLQAWFTQEKVNLLAIGALSLIGLPYLWKFLWAPFLDYFVPPWLGRRRGWIIIMQASLCVMFLLLAEMSPSDHPSWIGMLALCIAFISATQDIAIDAYRTDILLPTERGLGATCTTFGFRIAMLVSGGLALIMADHWGWRVTYDVMAGCIGLSMLSTIFAPEVPYSLPRTHTLVSAIVEPFKELWRREKIGMIVLFILLYKLGDALALALMSNFLLTELHFTLTDVGLAFKIFGLIATLLGVLIGGIVLIRISLFQALLYFGALQAISNLMFVVLAMAGKNYFLMVASIFIESFCSGMSTAAFVAFLMSLCHIQFSATQYASLSALFSLGRVVAGPFAAVMVQSMGWIHFYWWAFILSFPGMIVLIALRGNVRADNAEAMV